MQSQKQLYLTDESISFHMCTQTQGFTVNPSGTIVLISPLKHTSHFLPDTLSE